MLRWPFAFLVLVYQSAVLAIGQIWANKVRGILTTIGIMIGVASVTAVISTIKTLEYKVISQFEAFGTNKMFIFPGYSREEHKRNRSVQPPPFRAENFDGFLGHCPSVQDFTRMTMLPGPVAYRDRSENQTMVLGVEPTWHAIEHRTVIMGRPLSIMDNQMLRLVCLIDEKGRDRLGLDRDPTGEFITLGSQRLLVVGLLEPPVAPLMGQDVMEVYLPYSTAMALSGVRNTFVVAAAKSPDVSEDARGETVFFLRQKRHLRPTEPENFQVELATRFLGEFKAFAAVVTIIALGIVGISLLVGGVGIMNIMLVSVSERTREIGLRKAVGARPSAILLQFLVEAVMLCLLGGLVGLLVGKGITSIISQFIPPEAKVDRISIPAVAVFLALGFSGSVGLIFGMFPAIKAARLDPIEALRHE